MNSPEGDDQRRRRGEVSAALDQPARLVQLLLQRPEEGDEIVHLGPAEGLLQQFVEAHRQRIGLLMDGPALIGELQERRSGCRTD